MISGPPRTNFGNFPSGFSRQLNQVTRDTDTMNCSLDKFLF